MASARHCQEADNHAVFWPVSQRVEHAAPLAIPNRCMPIAVPIRVGDQHRMLAQMLVGALPKGSGTVRHREAEVAQRPTQVLEACCVAFEIAKDGQTSLLVDTAANMATQAMPQPWSCCCLTRRSGQTSADDVLDRGCTLSTRRPA